MSIKMGFADAVRVGGDGWRTAGMIAARAAGKPDSEVWAWVLASGCVSDDCSDALRMVDAQKYRALKTAHAPFSMPCIEGYRYRMGAVA